MPSRQQLERTQLIVSYMRIAEPADRNIQLIAFYCDLPYSSTYEIMTKAFPWMFERTGVSGIWRLTGAQPMPDYPINFDLPLPTKLSSRMARVKAALAEDGPVSAPSQPETGQRAGWTWRADVLSYIDTLWGGKSFVDILHAAYANNALDQLSAVGKTIARAADQMKKTGKVPY